MRFDPILGICSIGTGCCAASTNHESGTFMNGLRTLIRKCLLMTVVAAMATTNIALAETVLITGSNSGIGLEFAKRYAARGWLVVATHRRDTIPALLKSSPKNMTTSWSKRWTSRSSIRSMRLPKSSRMSPLTC
ncbi:MAG: SDR family NAD(P)-dependent oxidoreductase [Chromatiales bacterium]|nr:MAG: SDR family NAD(P)-dependent oxidoreductase [Chromatiales bacterium]